MPRIKRTIEECAEVAKGYGSRTEFQRCDRAVYLYCFRRGWLDRVCSHMVTQGSRELRYVYIIENEESVYVGLTYSINSRQRAHRSNPKMIETFGKNLTLIKVSDPLPKRDAAVMEDRLVRYFRESGKNVINSIKPGGLGGNFSKWDESSLVAATFGYSKISDFRRDKPHVYATFHRKGLLSKLREIMPNSTVPNGYWTFEKCRNEALKYYTRSDFKWGSPKAYDAACRCGWLPAITPHMPIRSCHKRNNLFDPIR